MFASLRSYLNYLREREQLLVVDREVDPCFELNAVVRKIQSGPNLPVLFRRVRGTRFPVFSNGLGNYGLVAQLLSVGIDQVASRWAELTAGQGHVAGEFAAENIPFKEMSLAEIPHIVFSEKDVGPYLTAGMIIAKDPDSGVVNLSYHRMQIVSDTELRCRLSTSGDLFRIHRKMEKRREPLSAAVVIGASPAVMLAAGTTISPVTSEYEFAARVAGKRFPTTPSPKLGLPVPEAAEIVIEGEILPGVRRPEGPFGEWMDYYVPVTDNHVFVVKHVYARSDAVFYAISAGSKEEITMTAIPIAGTVYSGVRTWVSGLRDVTCFPLLQFCAIKIAKASEGQPQRAMVAAFGSEMNRVLYCVVVDEDVDIHDWSDVLWAMATRCRPDRDVFQIPGVPSFARDPHKMHWGRIGIDATKPLDHLADFERKKTPGLQELRLEDYLSKL
jgi:UbiD family decarboxylase